MSIPPLLALLVAWSVLGTACGLWLDRRQAAAIAAHRDQVPPAFASSVSLEQHRRAAAYGLARLRTNVVSSLTDLAVGLAALLFGFDLASRLVGSLVPEGVIRSVLILGVLWIAATLIAVPMQAFRVLVLEHRFGFNRTSVVAFARDTILQTMLSAAIGAPLLACLFLAMRDLHGPWWLLAWAALSLLTLAAPSFYLRVIAPLFNRFVPLRAAIAAPVTALLERTGFRAGALLEMDASKRSSRGNAYVMGIGPAKRIVLFDTLIDAHPADEIEAVVAHELGHLHHRHTITGTLRGIVMLFGLCAAVGFLSRQPWLQPGFGISHPDPSLGLMLSLLLVGIAGPALSLAGNAVSRRHEYQADAFARRMVGAAPMISALTRLSRDNASTLTPDRLYSLVHHTHPPVPLRVARLIEEASA